MDNDSRKARIKTYLEGLMTGKIRGNAMECLEFVHRNPGTNLREMSEQICMPIQSSSSALSNLMDAGIIKEVGQIKLNDSYFSKLEFVENAEEQDQLAHNRKKEKIKQLAKKGLEEYGDGLGFTLKQELETI